jgi:RNA polymerase sigma factor (sigma-70 family)
MKRLAQIEAVYRLRGADLFRLALARTGDPEQARDAVQEGFARAIHNRRSYSGKGSLEAWIARCVINAAHDAWRSEARAPTGGSDGAEHGRDGVAVLESSLDPETSLVREALGHLPERQRDALFLRFYLGFDYTAIADALGVEVGTVSATLHAARASLAEELKEVVR